MKRLSGKSYVEGDVAGDVPEFTVKIVSLKIRLVHVYRIASLTMIVEHLLNGFQ
jgi:hypothetical protein